MSLGFLFQRLGGHQQKKRAVVSMSEFPRVDFFSTDALQKANYIKKIDKGLL